MPLRNLCRPGAWLGALLVSAALASAATADPTTNFCIERLHPPACVVGSWALDDDAFENQIRPMLAQLRAMGASDLTWRVEPDSGEIVTIGGDGQLSRSRRTNLHLRGTAPSGQQVIGKLRFTDEFVGTLCQHDAEPRWLYMAVDMERTVGESFMVIDGQSIDLRPAFAHVPMPSFTGSFTYRCEEDVLTVEMADRSLGAFRQKLVLKRRPR
ncbi:MAG: hypothetical protein AAF604_07795 [Acidobacteriota bacterium]